MKKLDLNIKLKEEVMDDNGKTLLTPLVVAKRWIGIMLERAINKPDPQTRQATTPVNMDVQRKYFKVMDALDSDEEGVVEMEDDTFDFMDRKFHQALVPVQVGVSEILVRLDNAINLAKVGDKKE